MQIRLKPICFIAIVGLLIFLETLGKLFAQGDGNDCFIHKSQDILNCALKNHPHIIDAQYQANRDQKLVNIARQIPNPEVEGRILTGKNGNDTALNSETTFLTTWEIGGKRKARKNQAKILGQQSLIAVEENRESVALQTVVSLYRLRQIRTELARVSETITTFDKILNTFKERPKLSPEQEVAFTSFELALEEYKLIKVLLIQEQSNVAYFLELATHVPLTKLQNYLPPFKTKWPTVQAQVNPADLSNTVLTQAKLGQEGAQADVKIAKSKTWPDLKIGPSFDTESLDNTTQVSGGISLSLPLPILSQNRGEKSYAHANKLWADNYFEQTIRNIILERKIQLQRYTTAVKALKQIQSPYQLVAKHENIESLFERGLVSSQLVIETHRQLYEITKSRNEQELTAIDALWRLFILDGRFLSEKI